jgi:hypothetical protein
VNNGVELAVGILISRINNVMAIANTPSEKASIRLVSDNVAIVEGYRPSLLSPPTAYNQTINWFIGLFIASNGTHAIVSLKGFRGLAGRGIYR